MNTLEELKSTLRKVDRSQYPQLATYTRQDIWHDTGPGGLYLVSLLAQALHIKPGAVVLDLGCGLAESSIYLAEHYDAQVIAVDRWQDVTQIAQKIDACNCRNQVFPLRLDASQPLPFAEDYFDAILCVNNLNFYGTDLAVLERIVGHLKPGGVFCSGGECLNEEFTPEQLQNPPDVYCFHRAVWQDDFLTSHSPAWWGEHIARSEQLTLLSSEELDDGRLYFEEQALIADLDDYSAWGLTPEEGRALEIRQILYGRDHWPYMTCYQLVAVKG